ncbi:MAG: hypothetical protein IJQ50_04125, partial [Clostridia bacterium]|nr:hypothetical protein [Clostridia bacterium]
MRKISKVLSYTLVLCMVLCTLSFNAFAAQLTAESEVLYTTTFRTEEFTAGDYNLSSGSSLQIGESDWYI